MKNKKLLYLLTAVIIFALIYSGPDWWRRYIAPFFSKSAPAAGQPQEYSSQRQVMGGSSGEEGMLAASAPAGTLAAQKGAAVKTVKVDRVKFRPNTKRDPTISKDERAAAEKRERDMLEAQKRAQAAEEERLVGVFRIRQQVVRYRNSGRHIQQIPEVSAVVRIVEF